jgi:hypothetical protein
MFGTTVGTTARWWRRVFYLGVIVTLLGNLKGYVLPVLNEVNGELGTNFPINNVMWFVVLPGLMGIAVALDRVIVYLMIVVVGAFAVAISQGDCMEPDIVIGTIRCGSRGMGWAKADAMDLFHGSDDILAALFHWSHEIKSLIFVVVLGALLAFGVWLLLALLRLAVNLYREWKKPDDRLEPHMLPVRRRSL